MFPCGPRLPAAWQSVGLISLLVLRLQKRVCTTSFRRLQLDASHFLPVKTIVVDWREYRLSFRIVTPFEDKVIWSTSMMTLANIIIYKQKRSKESLSLFYSASLIKLLLMPWLIDLVHLREVRGVIWHDWLEEKEKKWGGGEKGEKQEAGVGVRVLGPIWSF